MSFLFIKMLRNVSVIFIIIIFYFRVQCGILYPRASKTREIKYLDGIWSFSLNEPNNEIGELSDNPDGKDVFLMPVPSSYNDILTTEAARDHVGPVQYERTFYIPSSWMNEKRVWLRFGSVCYSAEIFINGKFAFNHSIGHLPFGDEVTHLLSKDENVIRVVVDNTLTQATIPQGTVTTLLSGRKDQTYTFDFFNYAGIDRPVVLYTTPLLFIDDITVHTALDGTTGIVRYNITLNQYEEFIHYKVTVLDKKNIKVSSSEGPNGEIKISNAHFWWPYLMHDDPGYLYTLKIEIIDASGALIDTYSQRFGIREIQWNSSTVTINGKPIYIRGFGRHEDSDIRGKGFDLSLIIRDHNLIRWVGANAYRTSHYPYAEEIMDLADSLGIMIIDESPAVNIDDITDPLLENHKRSLTELYNRDKNRPSVTIWSLANEPRSQLDSSSDYYRHIVDHMKSLDNTRPVTIVDMYEITEQYSEQFVDVIFFNRYNGWYVHGGDLDTIIPLIIAECEGWHAKYNKPIVISEYGADSLEGLHNLPTFLWTEEYQAKLSSKHFEAFDTLRQKGWFIGEMIWNFADFKTSQKIHRVGGNKKGIFTRQRQPKAAAHLVRQRYWSLAKELDNYTSIPSDLTDYVFKQ